MYHLNNNASISGTHLVGEINTSPRLLLKAFGIPNTREDSYKVSGSYTFIDDYGEVFTLYDWKSTSLYDPEYENPIDFWCNDVSQCFHIGGNTDCSNFLKWINAKLQKVR